MLKLMVEHDVVSWDELEKRNDHKREKLKKYLDWFFNYRDTNKIGLVSIIHPWESGLDNSPIWDGPLDKAVSYTHLTLPTSDLV